MNGPRPTAFRNHAMIAAAAAFMIDLRSSLGIHSSDMAMPLPTLRSAPNFTAGGRMLRSLVKTITEARLKRTYSPNGAREVARRQRQIAARQLSMSGCWDPNARIGERCRAEREGRGHFADRKAREVAA
jgi:hypothetical protein